MKKIWILCGLLSLAGLAHADSISISTSVPTSIGSPTFFSNRTLVMYSTQNVVPIYLLTYPESSTQTFVNTGFVVGVTTGPTTIPGYHGALYGESPSSTTGSKTLIVIGGN